MLDPLWLRSIGDRRMGEFVRNAWYPAAWSRDISRKLEQRRILGELVVLYRTTDGAVAALTFDGGGLVDPSRIYDGNVFHPAANAIALPANCSIMMTATPESSAARRPSNTAMSRRACSSIE